MSGFIQGVDRQQETLFPEALDEYITEDNSVRAVDVFIDSLNLADLGFTTIASNTRTTRLPPRYDSQAVCLRLPQSNSIFPAS